MMLLSPASHVQCSVCPAAIPIPIRHCFYSSLNKGSLHSKCHSLFSFLLSPFYFIYFFSLLTQDNYADFHYQRYRIHLVFQSGSIADIVLKAPKLEGDHLAFYFCICYLPSTIVRYLTIPGDCSYNNGHCLLTKTSSDSHSDK